MQRHFLSWSRHIWIFTVLVLIHCIQSWESNNIGTSSCSLVQTEGGQCGFCNSPTIYCCFLSSRISERYCAHLHTFYFIEKICFLSSLREIKSSSFSCRHSRPLIYFLGKFPALYLYLSRRLCWEVVFLVFSSASLFPGQRQITRMIACPAGPLCISLPFCLIFLSWSDMDVFIHCGYSIKTTPLTPDLWDLWNLKTENGLVLI